MGSAWNLLTEGTVSGQLAYSALPGSRYVGFLVGLLNPGQRSVTAIARL
jgi:hypothetical protein